MGKTYFERFMIYVEQEDLDTSKQSWMNGLLMVKTPNGGVEFIWLDNSDSDYHQLHHVSKLIIRPQILSVCTRGQGEDTFDEHKVCGIH